MAMAPLWSDDGRPAAAEAIAVVTRVKKIPHPAPPRTGGKRIGGGIPNQPRVTSRADPQGNGPARGRRRAEPVHEDSSEWIQALRAATPIGSIRASDSFHVLDGHAVP